VNQGQVLEEWRRAVESFGAAASCLRDGFYADSVSRSYYAMLHAAKAALQLQGIAAESHAAVRRLFGQHLVRTGLVEPEWAAFLRDSSDARLEAEYDVAARVSEAEARAKWERARAFLARIRELLLSGGLGPDELRTGALDD
jgi:hypothetical protein